MQNLLFLFCLVLICFCNTPVHKQHTMPPKSIDENSTTSQHQLPDSSTSSAPAPAPITLPVDNWRGKTFYVLEKQSLIRSSGYNLHSCMHTPCNALFPAGWELPNHRIKCESIEKDTLAVVDVTPDNGEWIVTFNHTASGRSVFGKTHKQALQEIALIDDLNSARTRWLKRFIYSRRGTVLIKNSPTQSSFSTIRVNILDSLLVTHVSWGTTPLPVKPILLSVTLQSTGESGFIPVRFSWTNTHQDQITGKLPWEEDIFEHNPKTVFDWDEYTWEVINNHRVILEMTPEQVELSWGAPQEISSSIVSQDNLVYTYPSHILVFENKKLIKIDARNR